MTKLEVYGADWCIKCKTLKKMLEKHEIEFDEVDVDVEPEKAQEHNIRSLPTTLVFDENGNLLKVLTGVLNIKEYK